jgi:hypothetical protein
MTNNARSTGVPMDITVTLGLLAVAFLIGMTVFGFYVFGLPKDTDEE